MTYLLSCKIVKVNLIKCRTIIVVESFTSYFDALERVDYLSKYMCVSNYQIKTKKSS